MNPVNMKSKLAVILLSKIQVENGKSAGIRARGIDSNKMKNLSQLLSDRTSWPPRCRPEVSLRKYLSASRAGEKSSELVLSTKQTSATHKQPKKLFFGDHPVT